MLAFTVSNGLPSHNHVFVLDPMQKFYVASSEVASFLFLICTKNSGGLELNKIEVAIKPSGLDCGDTPALYSI